MLDLWEHMAFADVSVSLFPSVTELNGWKRTIKVAVTCHCMEVSTTSALPAVSGATGAWHDLKHFFILVGADRAWEMFEALLRGAFCKFMAAGWYFLPCSALQLQEAQKKGISLFLCFLLSFNHLPKPLMLSTSCPWECSHPWPDEDFFIHTAN